jgi:hypothetical protein
MIVIDASVVINLNATDCAAEILGAVPSPFAVTDNVRADFGSARVTATMTKNG